MNVDAAWEEKETGGVNDSIRVDGGDGFGDVFDGLVFDQKIGFISTLGGDDGPVFDECGHKEKRPRMAPTNTNKKNANRYAILF